MYNVSKKLLTIFLIPILMTFGFKAHGQEVEEIIVTGKAIKESQMAAIEAKRQAVNVADIISADAIGRFPDVNLSDSSRLPVETGTVRTRILRNNYVL